MEISTYILEGKTVNKTDNGIFWRLIHDGTNVIDLFESDGITETFSNIFLSLTKDECLDEIDRLDLIYEPIELLPPDVETIP